MNISLQAFIGSARQFGHCPICSRPFEGGDTYRDEWVRHAEFSAQHLYDVRALVGNISGQDLSDLFTQIGLGPSPKGSAKLSGEALMYAENRTPRYQAFSEWLCLKPENETFDGQKLMPAKDIIKKYSGAEWPAETPLYLAARSMLAAAALAEAR